jgi:hypothetical protein
MGLFQKLSGSRLHLESCYRAHDSATSSCNGYLKGRSDTVFTTFSFTTFSFMEC